MEDDPLGAVAAGLLLEIIVDASGIDLHEMDNVIDHVIKELGVILSTRKEFGESRLQKDLRVLVLGELNRLIRRGMLEFASVYGPVLAIRTRQGVTPGIVRGLLKSVRS